MAPRHKRVQEAGPIYRKPSPTLVLLAACFFHQEKMGTRRAESDESIWSTSQLVGLSEEQTTDGCSRDELIVHETVVPLPQRSLEL